MAIMLAMLPAFGLIYAQQLKENVAVDARYKAEFIRQDRISMLPERLSLTIPSSPLQYSEKGVAADFAPVLYALPATGWQASRPVSDNKGYFDLGAGSWLNAVASAGYRFIDTETTTIGLRLQHNSSSLYKAKPFGKTMQGVTRKWYDDNIGVYGSHTFDGIGRLDAALQYHVGYFNYFGWGRPESSGEDAKMTSPSQTLNDIRFSAKWTAPRKTNAINWSAGASLRYFGYRALYTPDADGSYSSSAGQRETQLSLNGSVIMPWNNGSSIGADASLDLLFYSNPKTSLRPADNYGNFSITPYYRFSRGLLNISVGAQIDITARAGIKDDRYSLFHVSPDIKLDYQKGIMGVYLHLLGGTELNTLASTYQLDRYSAPMLSSTRPIYTPIDATLGFNLGPFSGFRGGVSIGFKSTNNVPLQGWYMAELINAPKAGWLVDDPAYGRLDCMSVRGISISGNASYSYGDIATLTLVGTYQPQNGTKGYFNGLDRPRWIGDASLSVRPIKPLKITVNAYYRGIRHLYRYVPGPNADPSVIIGGNLRPKELQQRRLPDFAALNIGFDYTFSPRLNLWAQANNLLNRHNVVFLADATEGINFLVGFGVTF